MKSYIVTDPRGVLVDGKRIAKDQKLPASALSSQVKAFIRFKQVKEASAPTTSKPATKAPAPTPKTQEPPNEDSTSEGSSTTPQTAAEYKEALSELGVEFKGNASTETLAGLYAEATAE